MTCSWRKACKVLFAALVVAAAVLHVQGRHAFPAIHPVKGDSGHFTAGHFGGLALLPGKPGERQHARDRWEPKPLLSWAVDPTHSWDLSRTSHDRRAGHRGHAPGVRRSQICRWLI